MSSEIQKTLLNAGFITDHKEYVWQENFSALELYKSKNGNCDVSQRHPAYVNSHGIRIALGVWLHNQRAADRKNTLESHRKKLLETLGVRWKPASEDNEESWNHWCELLRLYGETHDNFDVPNEYITPDNQSLGQWMSAINRGKRKITKARLKQLEEIGLNTKAISLEDTD